ncbi:hypothetical protein IBT49_22935 [Erwinia sp. S63]|uniref:hypothetical protein n=1 Tax=Erwinia sp. S63 TaxID=2769341 RepID=UPI00190B4722|nr:hypothetical protein [Erwinia sp. S63]MBK0098856.1 hypothetical protein [Erwinia sp. S63]
MIVSSTYYASAKYRSIKPELEQLQPDIHSCPVCLQMANLITRDDVIPAFTEHCRVCNQVEHYLSVPCPGCEQETRLDEGDEPFSCIHCGHTADRYDLVDEDDSLPEDYHPGNTPAGCSQCDGYDTVCQYASGYLCTQCLHFTETLGCCDYCSYSSTTVSEYSSMCGCDFCDGHPETWDLYDD